MFEEDVPTEYIATFLIGGLWALKILIATTLSNALGRNSSSIKEVIRLKMTSWRLIHGDSNIVICLNCIMTEILLGDKFFESVDNYSVRLLKVINNTKCTLTDIEYKMVYSRIKKASIHISDLTYMHISSNVKKEMVLLMILFAFEDILWLEKDV